MPASTPDSSAYYDQHSKQYIETAQSVDMSPLYERFLARLPAQACILDAGCGSGRDSLAFKRHGHDVTATDASIAMVRRASAMLDQEVLHLRHEAIDFVEAFDGIWSNASLLHVPQSDLARVFGNLRRALVPGGVLFASFKLGEGEVIHGERLLNNQTADTLRPVIASVPGLTMIDSWVSNDLRPGREEERWTNILCRRTG